MKLIIFILTMAILQVSAHGYAQNVSITQNDIPLSKVFSTIQQQTGYGFFWEGEDMSTFKVSLKLNNVPIEKALNTVLKGLPFKYTLVKKSIVISRIEESITEKISNFFSTIDISGTVVDEDNLPLPGATVMIKTKKIQQYIVTDKNGRFILLNVDPHATLIISYLGYLTKEVDASSNLRNIVLTLSNSRLDEVQIQAYGKTSRRMSTGDISSVSSIDIAKQPVGNVLLALQGRAPGLSIVQSTGMPGSAPTVRIRGTNSINAGLSPLYILDGIPVPDVQTAINGSNLGIGISALEGINPTDIESISVLKDADATAIYGSRGANGVILITTKKGSQGHAQVSFNAYTGISKVQHFVDMLDVHQYNTMRREALMNNGITPTAANSPDLFTYDTVNVHNWQKELIGGTAATRDANVSISGGSGGTTIYANAGYHKQGTVFPGDANDIRKSVRLNVNHVSSDRKLALGFITGYSESTLNLQGLDMTSFIDLAPSYPLYTQTGAPNFSGARGFPLAYTLQPFHSNTKNYNGHVAIGYEFIEGLSLKLDAGFNNSVNSQNQQNPLISLDPTVNSSGTLATGDYQNNTWIAEPQLTYRKQYKKHHLDFLAGGSFQKTNQQSINGQGSNFPNEALLGNLSSAGTLTISTAENEYAYASVFSRLGYNYDEKYLVNISYRRDGSSRFGPDHRFGNFGAVGLGWIFTKEAAIKNALPFLSFGKLRGSYGVNGNDQVGDYKYLSTYSSSSNGYQGTILNPSTLANPDFRWEENRKLEGAIELGFLKDKIILSTAFFRNRTSNQLIQYVLSPQTGFGSYLTNFPAVLQNQGWEFELNTKNINRPDFSWRSSFNLAFSKNKLVSFPGIEQTSYFSQYIVGQSINLVKGYVFGGLSNTGVPILKDLDNDGTVSATNDRIVLGNKDPFTGGMSNDFRYKNFEFSFFIDYSRINGYNPSILASRSGSLGTNRTTQVLDRWQKPGDESTTNTPLFTTSAGTYVARNYLQTDLNWLESDVFRLRNIAFSYNLPKKFINKLSLQNAKLFFLAQNVWTSGNKSTILDPETGYSSLPPLRTLTFGINFTF